MAFHRPDGTHRQAMLAVQSEPLVFLPHMREAIFTDSQNLDDAVLNTRLAFQAFRFIDTDHSCIPLII